MRSNGVLLDDVDELQQRMERPENQAEMADSREQLEQVRENIRRAEEELSKANASQALAAGTRAERDLQEIKEEFRRRTSSEFEDAMRDMRADARQLGEKQEDIGERMKEMQTSRRKSLGGDGERDQVQKDLKTQQEELGKLLEGMRTMSEAAEISEPNLSRHLYENSKNDRSTKSHEETREHRDFSEPEFPARSGRGGGKGAGGY